MKRASDLTKARRAGGVVIFALLTMFVLLRAGASITTEKPEPPAPVAGIPELWQIPYDIETGLPRNLLVGAPGLTEPTGPIITGYNSTNAVISTEMDNLLDFLEGLQ